MPSTSDAAPAAPPRPLPSLPRRVVEVVVAPERLAAALKHDPRWLGALVLGVVLVTAATALVPPEVWGAFAREQVAARGQELPEGFDFGRVQWVFGILASVVAWVLIAFVNAALVTFAFAFVLGDDGRFRQYLALTAHALLLAGIGALLTTPLKVIQEDPTLTLNLSLFAVGLDDEGYPMGVLRALDLFQLWSWAVIGIGAHEIDRRRSLGSAVGVAVGFALALALVFGFFV